MDGGTTEQQWRAAGKMTKLAKLEEEDGAEEREELIRERLNLLIQRSK